MRYVFPSIVLLASTALMGAQTAPSAAAGKSATAPSMRSERLGFTYVLPVDWAVDDMQETAAQVQQQAAQNAQSDAEMRAVGCMEAPFKAHRGRGGSTVAVVALPFDCFGQHYTNADLPAVATSIAEGLKKGWNVSKPDLGTYTLGSHSVWIERAKANLLTQPGDLRTLELTCSMLKNGAVCWLAFVDGSADLKEFEQGSVTLDGEPATALVPSTAFDKKP